MYLNIGLKRRVRFHRSAPGRVRFPLRLRRTDPQLSAPEEFLLLPFIAYTNIKARHLCIRDGGLILAIRGTTLVDISVTIEAGNIRLDPITGVNRMNVRTGQSLSVCSIHPLPGEFRVPIYCVAPSRSSLNSGSSLLFLFFAFAFCIFPLGIGLYYIHRKIICQFILIRKFNFRACAARVC
jgi:hypothetical protein